MNSSTTIALLSPAVGEGHNVGDHFIDLNLLDATGRGIDEASITDAGQEFKFLVKDPNDSTGESWIAPLGVGINGVPLKQSDGTYR